LQIDLVSLAWGDGINHHPNSPYKGYSKLRTHNALGSYGMIIPTGIGPP
jgi:hypothetical protein